jgi:hypothetical protein
MQDRVVGNGDEPAGVTAPSGTWPSFVNPQLSLFLRHWAERRDGLMMPRGAIDPAVLRTSLPDVWMFQYRAAEDRFVCTLSGERVNEAWGQSLIGKTPQDFMPPQSAAAAQDIYRRIVVTPALHVSLRRIVPAGRPEKGAERLVVPLGQAEGGVYGIFGLSLYHFDPVTGSNHPPHVGHNVTYYPCAGLPADPP